LLRKRKTGLNLQPLIENFFGVVNTKCGENDSDAVKSDICSGVYGMTTDLIFMSSASSSVRYKIEGSFREHVLNRSTTLTLFLWDVCWSHAKQ
jgi:hypothetical protein